MSFRYSNGVILLGYDPLLSPDQCTSATATASGLDVTVEWTAPEDTGGGAILNFYVASSPPSSAFIVSADITSVTAADLTSGVPYVFSVWAINSYGVGQAAATSEVTPVGPTNINRVLKGGNQNSNTVTYFTTTTQADSVDFGDLSTGTEAIDPNVNGNTIISVWNGSANSSSISNVIQYFTYNTLGNATDFGDLTVAVRFARGGAFGSDTRGVQAGGQTGPGALTNVANYITYATTGNATDFGDLLSQLAAGSGQSNSTRGVYAAGYIPTSPFTDSNVLQYVTIATTGNFTDFGDSLQAIRFNSPNNMCDGTRAIFGGGTVSGGNSNVIQYYTMATTGNTTDFGDLLSATYSAGAGQDNVSGFFCGGVSSNVIQKITIQTTGNSTDWADIGESTTDGRGGATSSNTGGFG